MATPNPTAADAVPEGGSRSVLNAAVIVAALGYFVDIYDLILVSIVRKPSLQAMGVPEDQLLSQFHVVLNWQMAGMLVGGFIFGILGDKKGRLQILFGSITLYSVATLLNGWVTDVTHYKILRVIAGIGLAGELGAGITLVSELLPPKLRGYGTMIVASVGVSGAVVANLVAKFLDWRWAFWVGGGLGILLLFLRIGVHESGMFAHVKASGVSRGNFFALFKTWDRFTRFLASILIAVPIWVANAILVAGAPEFAKALGVTGTVTPGDAVMLFYGGLVVGDVSSGVVSQLVGSRKRVVVGFVLALVAAYALYFLVGRGASPGVFLALCGLLGVTSGYWAIFATVAAEQFGTNIRATVATTVPNFVRGLVVAVTLSFQWLKPQVGLVQAALAVGAFWFVLALWGASRLRETFGVSLDYVEQD